MNTNSFWHTTASQSEIRIEKLQSIGIEKPISIISRYSAISLGTEKLVATGKISKEMYEIMKVPYMAGDFNFPLKYGYSLVGQTSEMDWVHVMHPHQSHAMVDVDSCFYFDSEIDPKLATQISNLETVVNAIWTANPILGDCILICGTGSIGVLLAQTLKKKLGLDVFIQETNPVKKGKLLDLGFQLCDNSKDYDICFNVSSNENGLQYCINHGKKEAKIIELSWYGDKSISLKLGADFHYKRQQILSSQVSEIPFQLNSKHDFLSRKKIVEKLLLTVDYSPFISNCIAFEELPEFFNKVREGKTMDDFITIVQY